ncbi:MAG TPA: glycosyltransferase family 2 protein [Leptolyngbyaceae cyanobacterium M33_DOE_097]|uniref:Glycosyltransferase family 2 protein n=1 Tax=Oscillatoriales cyanobacterium SpSt-418 TaxID=2282169 RepID=A0A7C3PJ15_9CYAN|nr:glycosyltransferase family 2 protein [Leptolyngbyaceae cyanobacterium M33_DOE_097]
MSNPQLSIIIPTHNRPHLLPLAVQSALNQTFQDLEVVVVDDASRKPVSLPEDSRVRVIRLEQGVGGAGARNVGTTAARGRWVTYLDDDDRLLPNMAELSLSALTAADVEPPVGMLSGLQKVNQQGEVLTTRLPPTLSPKGSHFFLEIPEPGRSYHTKQTLVVERDVVLKIGGWDETFRSRVHSEFFLRLNPACTLMGLPTVTYQLLSHSGTRVSGNPALRQESFNRLIQKHWQAFAAHPKMFAEFVYQHALTSYQLEQNKAALTHLLWALRLCPTHISGVLFWSVLSRLGVAQKA